MQQRWLARRSVGQLHPLIRCLASGGRGAAAAAAMAALAAKLPPAPGKMVEQMLRGRSQGDAGPVWDTGPNLDLKGGMEPWREWKEWEVSTFLVAGRLGELLFYDFVSSWTPCYAYAVLLHANV